MELLLFGFFATMVSVKCLVFPDVHISFLGRPTLRFFEAELELATVGAGEDVSYSILKKKKKKKQINKSKLSRTRYAWSFSSKFFKSTIIDYPSSTLVVILRLYLARW